MSYRSPDKEFFAEHRRRRDAERARLAASRDALPPREPMACVYGRVSHPDAREFRATPDSETCLSIDHQIEMARTRFAYDVTQGKLTPGTVWANQGWVGVKHAGEATADGAFIDQEVSGFSQPWRCRPAGRRCDEFLRAGDTLYIAYLERGFRDWKDFAEMLQYWKKRGIRVVIISPELDLGTITGEMLAGLIAMFSWFQSAMMSQKFREQNEVRRLSGRPTSKHCRIGWKIVWAGNQKRVVPDDEVRRMLLRLRALKGSPAWRGKSMLRIADHIEAVDSAAEGREYVPDYPHHDYQGRRWSFKRLAKIWSARDIIPLPSEMLPVGTKDLPPPPQRKDDPFGAARRATAIGQLPTRHV